MSRAQSEERPFEQRQADVVARYAGADNIDFLAHPNIQLPVNDFIAPEYIDTEASPKYIVIDGTYYLFCYLPSDAYPVRAIAGWMQLFVGMGRALMLIYGSIRRTRDVHRRSCSTSSAGTKSK